MTRRSGSLHPASWSTSSYPSPRRLPMPDLLVLCLFNLLFFLLTVGFCLKIVSALATSYAKNYKANLEAAVILWNNFATSLTSTVEHLSMVQATIVQPQPPVMEEEDPEDQFPDTPA